MQRIRISLDWTPNVNHSGFIAALHHGWYKEAGIDVDIQHPGNDNYTQSPAKKVELGLVDLALCPMESLLSYRTKEKPFPLKAIAAVLQNDLSSIAVLESSGIERPAQLDGKTYASYKAKYEDAIVASLVRNDGGKGDLVLQYPERLGIWNILLEQQADSTWIFANWEGVQAKLGGVALRHFKMADYGIPYGYSPVLACSEAFITEHASALRNFLAATAKGFAWAASNAGDMAKILLEWVPEADKDITMLEAAQKATGDHYLSPKTGSWGHMDEEKVEAYLKWLLEKGLETTPFSVDNIVTNELL
ncbi:hypothetical protein FisN_6Hh163 [Fistulifera solaris]|jgi:ABC-type nitrate/sulfonate/bicarbonate transport system substrate-binding protein|uniref:Thiamine pyrimidine synthase n=1 Tax=Fistulifera solaris TaxID=1519565 RepID=A0A1Z5JNE9_FISSO|nr:hypothetical protein FisN_6Hh163 [Fistulifera solaris]|eukprot:GAX15540.1 hypothetical protein FisN_6Hh163 [Fistulifera solaris]